MSLTNGKSVLNLRAAGLLERARAGHGSLPGRITSGTGSYAQASGYLFVNFISEDQNILASTINGQLCIGAGVVAPQPEVPPAPVTPPSPPRFPPPRLNI